MQCLSPGCIPSRNEPSPYTRETWTFNYKSDWLAANKTNGLRCAKTTVCVPTDIVRVCTRCRVPHRVWEAVSERRDKTTSWINHTSWLWRQWPCVGSVERHYWRSLKQTNKRSWRLVHQHYDMADADRSVSSSDDIYKKRMTNQTTTVHATSPRRSLLTSYHHMVPRYTNKCDFIHPHKKSTAWCAPVCMKPKNDPGHRAQNVTPRSAFFRAVTQRTVPISNRRFGATCRSRPERLSRNVGKELAQLAA